MRKSIKRIWKKHPIRGTCIVLGPIGIIGGILLMLFQVKNGGVYMGVYSMICALIIASLQAVNVKKLAYHVDTSITKLDNIANNIDTSIKKSDSIANNMNTRHISPFPNNFKDIENLLDICEDSHTQKELWIYTDALGYGIWSNNKQWKKFFKKVKKIIEETNVHVYWYFYGEILRDEKIKQQVSELDSKGRLISHCEACKKSVAPCPNHNKKDRQTPCTSTSCDLHIMESLKKITVDSVVEMITKMQQNTEQEIRALRERYCKFNMEYIEKELPFFAWFVYENIQDESKPLKAMVSFPNYGRSTEEGLITENEGLISALHSALPKYKLKNK
ncbi:MAG: hypothetical protein LBR36_03480 [Bacteroidales bacterium]|jgi:hypothetical protein|nr:hypothetical protein [Bacteroidales bacterium]